jgi:microcystin degradation protein MlrC
VADWGKGEVQVVPIFRADATSGGPLEKSLYDSLKKELVDGIAKIDGLSGVYLDLHGAMGVQGMRDPEGDLLAAIRQRVGNDIPIGVSFDLHANVTQARAKLATFIVGYKTSPHRDFFRTGYDSGKLLVRTIRGEIHPVMVVRKLRLLKGGGMDIDFLKPMRPIYREMKREERRTPKVLSVSNFMVHIWLDDPELGWSTVAVTDGDPGLAAKLADHIADLDWAVRGVKHPAAVSPDEMVKQARKAWWARWLGTVVVCDSSDAVGAGGPGESTWILDALLRDDPDLVSYVPLRDAEAARTAYEAGVGQTVTLSVGGKLDKVYNKPISYTGVVDSRTIGVLGKTVVVRYKGIRLILSELPATAATPRFFRDLGLRVGRADLVVVKNLFPFRYTYALQNRLTINVESPGTTSVDVFSLKYTTIPRPIYPLDDIASWR